MSAFGHAAWSLFSFASAVVLAADGLHIIPVRRHGMSILGGALGVVVLAALVDGLSRRKEKP
jgi:prolipoprotein diacylglyceryltransferase